MAIKVTSVRCVEVKETNRFEPKMYVFRASINRIKNKYHCLVLGDETITTDIKRGQSPKPETYKDKDSGRFIFIRTADVKKYTANTELTVYLDEKTLASQKTNRIKSKDILISVVGNYLGSSCVIPNSIDLGAFNDNSARIRIINDSISPYYVSAFINSTFGQKLIHSLATRTGQKILSAGNVKKLFIPIVNNNTIADKYEKAVDMERESNSLITQSRHLFYNRIDINFNNIIRQNSFSVSISDFAEVDLWTPMYSYPLYVNTLKAIRSKWNTINVGKIANLIKGDEVGSETYIGYMDKRKTDVPFVRTSDIVNYETDQYPDFYIPLEIYDEVKQGFQAGDVLFTKDGKIGMVGMLTEHDKSIISSGFVGLRLNKNACEFCITPEYLFLVLTIKEIGIYASKRRTVVASTIPHLREERLKEIEIPILDKDSINEITCLVKEAFKLKDEKKRLITEVRELMDSYFT